MPLRFTASVPGELRFRDLVGSMVRAVCLRVERDAGCAGLEWRLMSAYNEAFNNIVKHAYAVDPGEVEVVLLVDDEAPVRQITRQTLEAFGYRVLMASDGAVATALFAEQKENIAVVLTDMMMPIMDGPAMIPVLMRMDPKVRIITASGVNAKAMVAKANQAGVKYFIPKPYSAETLLKTLHQILHEQP